MNEYFITSLNYMYYILYYIVIFFLQEVNTKDDIKMENILPGDKAEFSWFVEPWQAAVDIALINTEYSKWN